MADIRGVVYFQLYIQNTDYLIGDIIGTNFSLYLL